MTEQIVPIVIPEMTQEQYAAAVGVSVDTLKGWIKRGYIPTIKMGKHRMINVAERIRECANHENHQ